MSARSACAGTVCKLECQGNMLDPHKYISQYIVVWLASFDPKRMEVGPALIFFSKYCGVVRIIRPRKMAGCTRTNAYRKSRNWRISATRLYESPSSQPYIYSSQLNFRLKFRDRFWRFSEVQALISNTLESIKDVLSLHNFHDIRINFAGNFPV